MPAEQVVYAVDDDGPFLKAMECSLGSLGHRVSAYSCARAFLTCLEPEPAGCLVADLRMPHINGIELQNILFERQIRLPIIFVTGHGDAATAVAALKNGAIDFLEKPFSETQLLASVIAALEKDTRDQNLAREQDIVRERFVCLSPREREVFALVVSDRPNKQIAQQLRISPRTVEHHREHLMLKMQAHSLAELITMAVLCGIHELHLSAYR